MAAEYDFAVIGSTPLAQLLAGLLASKHGRKIALVGEGRASYRLPRAVDLSVGAITRPQTWAVLTETAPETARLLSRIAGRHAISRIDLVLFAESAREREALSHIRHMAQGFGVAAEPVGQSVLGPTRQGTILRDTLRLNRAHSEPAIDKWLSESGAVRVTPQSVSVHEDGQVDLIQGDQTLQARQAILADDEAIMVCLPLRQWPTLFRRVPHTSILTTPTRPLAASVMHQLDSGLFLTQQMEGGVGAFGPGAGAEFARHLQLLLGEDRQVEQAGQTAYSGLTTRDGAPAFGRAAGQGADIVAGLGCYGVFVVPALARWLAGAATAREASWFESHLVNRDNASRAVAEFTSIDEGIRI